MPEAEFEKLYKEMDHNYLKPLWTSERTIVPIQPHSKAVACCGRGRGCSILPAGREIW